ncbi:unnamed protein product [Mytilus coruscus]|uniref:B box-type domain-containing protein n=1 Tax=Mytilus coruscus TaxID=42192 RepID=A0A6J8ARN6_MYTCO|nr:unnamed protein product [Mytilus coruscus]
MASSTGKLCGPCEARYKTTTAVSWCMDCDDGLCSPCLEDHKVNKASKKHQTIPVGQYVGIESVSSLIKQDCEEHDQRLTFYCLDHCVTACALCVPEKHKQCTSLKPIEELARNAKSSAELFEIEKGIKELDNTVDELKNHRQRNIDTIKGQRKTISQEIKSFRKQINKHLDKIESDLLKELESKSEQNISEINILLAKLKERGANIKSLGKTIHQLKESLSDVQVFLATKGFGEKLLEEQEWVATVCTQNEAKESVLELSTDPQLKQMVSDLKGFGMIHVVRNPCQIKTDAWEQQRAQLNVPMTAAKDIDQTELELIREISFGVGENIKDCVIVNDGRMVFADHNNDKVLVYNPEGQLSQSISVDKSPFGLDVISSITVAVTCRKHETINIVNIDDCDIKQKIKVGKPCCGLSYHDDKLYVLTVHTGIIEFDLSGNITRTIPVYVPDGEGYLSYYKDTFCYSCYQNVGEKNIACCDNNGREIWRLDVADSGVTADNYGNYFASNYSNGTVQIVSADGKKAKQLLDLYDLHIRTYLEGVFFDKNSSTLLVSCSEIARLYRAI